MPSTYSLVSDHLALQAHQWEMETITLFEALCIIICVCSTLGILGHDLFLDASGDAGINLTVFYNASGGKSKLISLIKW